MKRAEQREWLVKLAYELAIKKEPDFDPEILLTRHELPAQNAYLKGTLEQLRDHRREIDQAIEGALIGWSLDRLNPIDKAILQIATCEIRFNDSIPVSVTINESVEIAKRFSDAQSYRFINGVLSQIARQA